MRTATLAAAVLVCAGQAGAADTPLAIGEDSIRIESPALEFTKFTFFFGAGQTQDDAHVWENPESKAMRRIDVDGNNRADCNGSASCAVYVVYDDGSVVLASSTRNNGRGLRVASTRRWGEYQKQNGDRRLVFPGPRIRTAFLLVVRGNTTTRTDLCTGTCEVRIQYE